VTRWGTTAPTASTAALRSIPASGRSKRTCVTMAPITATATPISSTFQSSGSGLACLILVIRLRVLIVSYGNESLRLC